MDPKLKAGNHCPVIHFDQQSPEHAAHWPEQFKEMREKCPRAWTEKYGGFWVATRYNDIVKIAQQSDLFSSERVKDPETGEWMRGVAIPGHTGPRTIPLEADNPEWYNFRSLLNRHFAPKVAEAQRGFAEGICRTLINNVIETGEFDIISDFTNPMPAIFTMNLLGLELGSWHEYADAMHKNAYVDRESPEFPNVITQIIKLGEKLLETAYERRKNPREDLMTHIANDEVNGKKLTDEEVVGMAVLVVMGGVDTTAALTSNVLHHLHLHPDQRKTLMENPSMLPIAREEFVRFFSPVHAIGRNATGDFEMDGWEFKKGDRVWIPFSAANRDEEIFENPNEVQLDRFPNRHIGFGAGNHRCIGSFFARVMFESMIAEVFARIPDYKVIVEKSHRYPSLGFSNGWIDMPATFTPGPKLEGGFPL